MHLFRARARVSVLAALALTWQIVALMFVPAALCCQAQASGAMANCPMQHSTQHAECPMHMQAAADHDCHCPQLGCSQTDQGFLALLGPIAVLPDAASTFALHQVGDALLLPALSSISLAPAPISPPPRA